MRRERLQRIKGFNESVYKICGEDYDYHLRTCREGPVAFVNVSTIKYQIGMPGQLTHRAFSIHMARGFLNTVTATLAQDRDRIDLPARMIAELQAKAHRWLALEYVEIGERRPAREHAWKSLSHRAWQPKVWVFYLLTLLPPKICATVLSAVRTTRRAMLAEAGR
jgi:GT2 family glycosyltransferase